MSAESGQISGKEGRFFIGGNTELDLLEVTLDEFHIDAPADDILDRSSSSRGRSNHDSGFVGPVKVSTKGYFDKNNNPAEAAARNLRAGVKVPDFALYVTETGPKRFFFPRLLLTAVKVTDISSKRAEMDLEGLADGDWYYTDQEQS